VSGAHAIRTEPGDRNTSYRTSEEERDRLLRANVVTLTRRFGYDLGRVAWATLIHVNEVRSIFQAEGIRIPTEDEG
jgi:hypothetical protein